MMSPCLFNLTVLFSLERAGMLFRLDEKIVPTRNRLATVSTRELGQLSKVKNIIRKGRLKAVTGVAPLFTEIPVKSQCKLRFLNNIEP